MSAYAIAVRHREGTGQECGRESAKDIGDPLRNTLGDGGGLCWGGRL